MCQPNQHFFDRHFTLQGANSAFSLSPFPQNTMKIEETSVLFAFGHIDSKTARFVTIYNLTMPSEEQYRTMNNTKEKYMDDTIKLPFTSSQQTVRRRKP